MTKSSVEIDTVAPLAEQSFRLQAAYHVRIEPPFLSAMATRMEQVDLLAQCIGAQVRRAWDACGRSTDDLVLTSTVLSGSIVSDPTMANLLLDGIERACGKRPVAIMDTYMCVGWGYALRMFAQHTNTRAVTVVVTDVDVEDLIFRRGHPPIGHMSFGIMAGVVELPVRRNEGVVCDGPFAASAFNEMVRAMRTTAVSCQPELTVLPFMRADMDALARRVIAHQCTTPNRFEEFGHCYGADTWIGLIDYVLRKPVPAVKTALMGAIAFNGYYTLCKMLIDPFTQVGFDCITGEVASVTHYIQQHTPALPAGVNHD